MKTRNIIDIILAIIIILCIVIWYVCYWTYQKGIDAIDLEQEIIQLKSSIVQHKVNHDQAWIEKESCIKSCEESRDKQAEEEHKWADNDRARLKEIEESLGLNE